MKKLIIVLICCLMQQQLIAQETKGQNNSFEFVKIGETFFDLQTTASVGRRIAISDNGYVATCWSYVNKRNANRSQVSCVVNQKINKAWGTFPTKSFTQPLSVSPTIGLFDNGAAYVISTDSETGVLLITKNSEQGKSDWVTDTASGIDVNRGFLRNARAINVGDTIYVIAQLMSDRERLKRRGIVNPIVYSKSNDRGKTWSEIDVLPGYDSVRYIDGQMDAYTMDAHDSIVTVVIGGVFKDVTLFKSSDYGKSWTTNIIDSFAFPRFEWGKHIASHTNPAISFDGSLDVVIDNKGNVHVACGRISYSDEDTTDNSARSGSYYDLYHWSENQPTWKSCGTPINLDGLPPTQGEPPYDITAETTNSIDSLGKPMHGLGYAARYENTSGHSTHPSLSVGPNNELFVTWDCPVEFTFNDYLANYRDVHISFSLNDGKTWATTQNATQVRSREAVFASMSRRADDFVHLIFQMDDHPGTHFRESVIATFHSNDTNGVYYAAIPLEDIIDSIIGVGSVHNIKRPKIFFVSQNRPNPFSNATNVVVYLRAGSDLTCTVTDATGKVVSTQKMGYKGAGNHSMLIQGSDLTSGVYFYTLRTKDSEVTKKMQVLK
ncbi:MAG: hypothetical protein ACI9JN_002299 [Bacteroidia bacterium]|jgi:hypothetical protein